MSIFSNLHIMFCANFVFHIIVEKTQIFCSILLTFNMVIIKISIDDNLWKITLNSSLKYLKNRKEFFFFKFQILCLLKFTKTENNLHLNIHLVKSNFICLKFPTVFYFNCHENYIKLKIK